MTIAQRKTYFSVTLALYIVFFLIYGLMGLFTHDLMMASGFFSPGPFPFWGDHPAFTALFFGLLAAYGLGGLVSGFIFVFRYIAGKSTRFKVACCFLFPIPLWCAMLFGLAAALPYWLYNLYKIKRNE